MGLSLWHLQARHLLLLGRRSWRWLLLERLQVGRILHLLSFLVIDIWTAPFRLLLLFGGLGQDLMGFPGQTIGTQGVRGGADRRFRRRWTCGVVGCQRRWGSRRATCQQAQSD